jgi:DNA-binding transcriptional LysR family regulator
MELSWLEDFLELARTGNFSRSAEARHLTQPAFSRRIRALEDWAGVSLFDRSAHPVTLTAAGQRFQPLAGALLRDLQQAREAAREAAAGSAATLHFAATHALSLIFFTDWWKRFEHEGRWTVHLASDGLPACESLLRDGRAQFLLCHVHEAAPANLPAELFASVEVGRDALIPCAAPALAGPWQASPPAQLPLLAYSSESGLGRIFRAVLASRLALHTVMTADLAGLLHAMCLDGRGLAWLPRSLAADDLAAGRLQEIAAPDWQIPLKIRLFRAQRSENPAAEQFWRILAQGVVV